MMTFDEFWVSEFGNKDTAKDFTGKMIRRGDHRKENSQYGWDIDHILPLAANGVDDATNLQIVNIATNRLKADLTSFVIDGVNYQVMRNTPQNTIGRKIAPYSYKNKKYCITIV